MTVFISAFELCYFYKRYIDENYENLDVFTRISKTQKELLNNKYNKLGSGNTKNDLSSFCDALLSLRSPNKQIDKLKEKLEYHLDLP